MFYNYDNTNSNSWKEAHAFLQDARERITTGPISYPFEYEVLRFYVTLHIYTFKYSIIFSALICIVSFFIIPFLYVLCTTTALGFYFFISRKMHLSFLKKSYFDINIKKTITHLAWLEGIHSLIWSILILKLFLIPQASALIISLTVTILLLFLVMLLETSISKIFFSAFFPLFLLIIFFIFVKFRLIQAIFIGSLSLILLAILIVIFRVGKDFSKTFEHNAEKDALIIELEQAKTNSDEARRRAETANSAKSKFLATMSHELRTPLNAILGFSDIMMNERFGAHYIPSYKEYSQDIHSSGQHLLNLINEILDLSRIEAGRFNLKEELISLPRLAHECVHLMKVRAKARSLSLVPYIEEQLSPLKADERAIKQIILNLL